MLIRNLDDQLYNTLPSQPPGKPKPKKPPTAAATPGTSKAPTSSSEPAKECLHSAPPPDDPLEDANVWAEILLLEGRRTNNQIAEGLVLWLNKHQDSTIHEVTFCCIYISFFLYKWHITHSLCKLNKNPILIKISNPS